MTAGKGIKPTPTEDARITDKAIELYRAGYTTTQIGRCMGFARNTIAGRLNRAGIPLRQGENHTARTRPDPPLFNWRDSAHTFAASLAGAALDISYRQSTTVSLWRATLIESQHDNAVNRFANDIADAIEAGDKEWLGDTAHLLTNVRAYLDRLELVLVDDVARRRAITDPAERDDLARLSLNGAR